MSDAAEPREPEADAWATACEEDLAAEKARRREEYGQQPLSAAEELRRLADAVSERVAELGKPFGGTVASAAAQGAAQQLIAQARAAIEPVVERNPRVFDHIAAAGGELLAAYRAAVQDAEGRWTAGASGTSGTGRTDAQSGGRAEGGGAAAPADSALTAGGPEGGGAAGLERIDLDKDPAESPARETGTPGTPGTSGTPGGQDAPRAQGPGAAGPREHPGDDGGRSGRGSGDDG